MLLASVVEGFSHVGSFVKRLFEDPPCKCCEVYRECLENESQRARYYERLLLSRLGVNTTDTEVAEDVEFLPTFSRTATLSQIRRSAERRFAEKKDTVANKQELTEAEKLFEQSLNNQGMTSNV